ncbi:Homeodomain-like super protein [Rhizophlyctis rosea]|nr:Homeodomain-like super protein [Rhizophlyctis rosea]
MPNTAARPSESTPTQSISSETPQGRREARVQNALTESQVPEFSPDFAQQKDQSFGSATAQSGSKITPYSSLPATSQQRASHSINMGSVMDMTGDLGRNLLDGVDSRQKSNVGDLGWYTTMTLDTPSLLDASTEFSNSLSYGVVNGTATYVTTDQTAQVAHPGDMSNLSLHDDSLEEILGLGAGRKVAVAQDNCFGALSNQDFTGLLGSQTHFGKSNLGAEGSLLGESDLGTDAGNSYFNYMSSEVDIPITGVDIDFSDVLGTTDVDDMSWLLSSPVRAMAHVDSPLTLDSADPSALPPQFYTSASALDLDSIPQPSSGDEGVFAVPAKPKRVRKPRKRESTSESASRVDEESGAEVAVNQSLPRHEIDSLFKELGESSESENIISLVQPSNVPAWYSNAQNGFSIDQLERLRKQMNSNMQLVVQAYGVQKVIHGSKSPEADHWKRQLETLETHKQSAQKQSISNPRGSLFNHAALSRLSDLLAPHKCNEEIKQFASEYAKHHTKISKMRYVEKMKGGGDYEIGKFLSKRANSELNAMKPISLPQCLRDMVGAVGDVDEATELHIVPVKYHNSTKPEFSKQEDELLALGLNAHGSTDMKSIRAHFLPARTVSQLKIRQRNTCTRATGDNPIKRWYLLPFKPLVEAEREMLKAGIRKYSTAFRKHAQEVFDYHPIPLIKATWDDLWSIGEVNVSFDSKKGATYQDGDKNIVITSTRPAKIVKAVKDVVKKERRTSVPVPRSSTSKQNVGRFGVYKEGEEWSEIRMTRFGPQVANESGRDPGENGKTRLGVAANNAKSLPVADASDYGPLSDILGTTESPTEVMGLNVLGSLGTGNINGETRALDTTISHIMFDQQPGVVTSDSAGRKRKWYLEQLDSVGDISSEAPEGTDVGAKRTRVAIEEEKTETGNQRVDLTLLDSVKQPAHSHGDKKVENVPPVPQPLPLKQMDQYVLVPLSLLHQIPQLSLAGPHQVLPAPSILAPPVSSESTSRSAASHPMPMPTPTTIQMPPIPSPVQPRPKRKLPVRDQKPDRETSTIVVDDAPEVEQRLGSVPWRSAEVKREEERVDEVALLLSDFSRAVLDRRRGGSAVGVHSGVKQVEQGGGKGGHGDQGRVKGKNVEAPAPPSLTLSGLYDDGDSDGDGGDGGMVTVNSQPFPSPPHAGKHMAMDVSIPVTPSMRDVPKPDTTTRSGKTTRKPLSVQRRPRSAGKSSVPSSASSSGRKPVTEVVATPPRTSATVSTGRRLRQQRLSFVEVKEVRGRGRPGGALPVAHAGLAGAPVPGGGRGGGEAEAGGGLKGLWGSLCTAWWGVYLNFCK